MIKNLCSRKSLFTQTWKLSNEVIERMELIKKAIEELRSDILKEIPEIIDHSNDIKMLQNNIMELQRDIDMLKENFNTLESSVQELLDAPDVVIPEAKTEVINKYFTKTVYHHNLWVYGVIGATLICSIWGLVH